MTCKCNTGKLDIKLISKIFENQQMVKWLYTVQCKLNHAESHQAVEIKGATILVASILVCGNRVGASDVLQCAYCAYLSILTSWAKDRCNTLPP